MDNTLQDVLREITTMLNNYGPKAAELTLEAVQWTCISEIAQGFVLLLVSASMGVFCYKTYSTAKDDDGIEHGIILMISGVASLLTGVAAVFTLLDVKHWIGIQRPDMYLAMQVLEKLN